MMLPEEMEHLVRRMDALIVRAEKCYDAKETLGGDLKEARLIVNRMQYLIDIGMFSPAAQAVIQYEIMRDRA